MTYLSCSHKQKIKHMRSAFSPLLYLLLILFCSLPAKAQTDLSLTINHLLGDEAFALLQSSSNNLGMSFEVDRLEYYISGISLLHDGGQIIEIEDLYLLVDASEPTEVVLGSYDISSLEGIQFSVGVDEDVNHEDPALWASDHPLAPQNPSMHWGWSAGYRFAAVEGTAGANAGQLFELHGLGDRHYVADGIHIPLSLEAQAGQILIEVDADYNGIFYDMDLSSGVVSHGEINEAAQSLENFYSKVFVGQLQENVSSEDLSAIPTFQVSPNPSSGRLFMTANGALAGQHSYTADLVNVLGQRVDSFVLTAEGAEVEVQQPGLYFLQIRNQGAIQSSQPILISK